MSKGLLFDVTRCVGCGMCQTACREANGLPETEGTELSEHQYTVLRRVEAADGQTRHFRRLCMHCLYPTCESVCPVGALHRTDAGPVVWEEDRCIGCRYCMMACPYGVPRYEWSSVNPRVRKCILCSPRVERGEPTACAQACPMGATVFGDRSELLVEARRRVREAPDKYVPLVFGDQDGGGTSVMMISDVPFDKLGLPIDLPNHALGEYTEAVLSKLPNVVLVGGSLLFGLHWIIHRRMELAGASSSPAPARVRPDEGEDKK